MAEGEGLLGQQLSAATQIPYENIKSNQTSLEMGINAWSTATQIKLKRQELEGRMQALVEKNRQMELMGELREKEMGIRMGIAQQNAGFKEQSAARAWEMMGLREQEFRSREAGQDFKQDQVLKREHDTQGLYHDIYNINAEKGTPEWEKQATEIFSRYPDVPASRANIIARQVWGQHQSAYDSKTKALDAEEKNIRHSLSYDLFGVGNKGDVAVLETPERFVQNYAVKKKGKDQSGAAEGQVDPETGKPYEFKTDKAGNYIQTPYKSFRFVDPAEPDKPKYKPIAVQRLNDYTNNIKANREARAKLGDRPHNPEAGVTRYEPTDYDIERLKTSTDPNTRRRFESHFGDGSSDPYLRRTTDDE